MANTPDMASCLNTEGGRSELLPLSPFYALRYHFGMLLGVEDFETEQAYHRAKMRLHNAWLHREGVVWGFDVKIDKSREEIKVTPGLALDAAGHELHLEDEACLNVSEWFAKHMKDEDLQIESSGDTVTFHAHVVVRFKACLTRQVPALSEPCDGSGSGTAYSRLFETVEILLLANPAPPRVYPYHRLRLLFGLEPPRVEGEANAVTEGDQEVLAALQNIRSLPEADQAAAYLEAFHRFAALDEIELKPATSEDGARTLLFPGREDDPVVLANVKGITLTKQNDKWVLTDGLVDTSVRPSHVATTTIQDLLCGMLPRGQAGEVGPRVDPSSVTISDTEVVLKFDQPLNPVSVTADAFSITVFDEASGWQSFTVSPAVDAENQTVTLTPNEALSKNLTRVIARGTGPAPIIGANNLPIAGATTDPPAPNGADFVMMRSIPKRKSRVRK